MMEIINDQLSLWFLFAGLSIFAAFKLFRSRQDAFTKEKAMERIESKKREVSFRKDILSKRLEINGELLTPSRLSILELGLTELVNKLRTSELKPLDVLNAYQAKMLEVDRKYNAVCDVILETDQWAVDLEMIPIEERGLLYGVPISLKECFFVKGYDTTLGQSKLIGMPSLSDGSIVRALKNLHAIPFCLTNTPQAMSSFGCSNAIFGSTINPHNPSRSPGGSTGGEAALIAAGGSIMGLGSDIGGSMRIPSHFSGICALKPTNGRIYTGGRISGCGVGESYLRVGIYGTSGFMSKSVEGLILGMKALLQKPQTMTSVDWRVVPIPWKADVFTSKRKLKVGWYDQDGYFPATPGCSRAVREVVHLLEKDGHQVTPFKPPGVKELFETYWDFIVADKSFYNIKAWHGEVMDESMTASYNAMKMSTFIKKIIMLVLWFISKKMFMFMQVGKEYSKDLWVKNADKDKLIYTFMAAWEAGGYDVLVCPAFTFPACPPEYCTKLYPAESYTAIYNLVDCPVGVLPVTKETSEDQSQLNNYPVGQDLLHRMAAEATRGGEGLPIGVQIVGRQWREEVVLDTMSRVQQLLRNR